MRIKPESSEILVIVENEAETDRLGRVLASVIVPGTVIGLMGPLGAGKTRLARAIAEALGVNPLNIASPTFVLINEYEGQWPIYHFDVYRLKSVEDFDALGPEDYWGGDGVCLIEWADRVLDRLPTGAWTIQIEPIGEERRIVLDLRNESLSLALAARLQST